MSVRILFFWGAISLSLIANYSYANESRQDLTIIEGQNKYVITENAFRHFQVDSVVVQDHVYGKPKRYTGYWLTDILAFEGIHPDPSTVWTFTALDGYKVQIAVADVINHGYKGFVAIADLDKEEGWEKFQHGKEWITPGPYYVVWTTPLEDFEPSVKLPWPYQVIEISIDKVDDSQDKLMADSNDKSESVFHGNKTFKQNCMACHSINLEGGTVGPELNTPKNILEYESRSFLTAFIKSPSSFRAKSKMPDFNNTLTDQDISDILDYLTWMSKHKEAQ